MNTKGLTQARIEVIYKILNSQHFKKNEDDTVLFHYNKNSNILRAINQKYDYDQKLNAYTILGEKETTKQLNDIITDTGGPCLNSLLKGFNSTLIMYGVQERQKNQSIFRSLQDVQTDLNVLTAIYQEVLKHSLNLQVGVSFLEISNSVIAGSETFKDLLGGPKAKFTQKLDLQLLTNVSVRSSVELNKLISIALKRSRANNSNYLCQITFYNPKEQKKYSFYLLDLVGFTKETKRGSQNLNSLSIWKILDNLISIKDQIETPSETRLRGKNLIDQITRTSDENDLNDVSKFTECLANIVLRSQTFLFVPLYEAEESFADVAPILDRFAKINSFRYFIEKEMQDPSKKNDIVPYASYIKQVESENGLSSSLFLPLGTPHAGLTPTPSPFISGQMSPIMLSLFPEKKEATAQSSKRPDKDINVQRKDYLGFDDIEDTTGNKIETATFPEEAPRETKFSFFMNQEEPNLSYPTQSSPNRKLVSQNYAKENQNNYFIQYKMKAKEILKIMNDFIMKKENFARNNKTLDEYYTLSQNFDLLYNLFQEGESVKQTFMGEFINLGKTLNELKDDYENRLYELKCQCQDAEKKIKNISEGTNLKALLQRYDEDIERLAQKNSVLKEENLILQGEVAKFYHPEPRVGVPKEYEILIGKYNHLIKQYYSVMKQTIYRESELNSLKRRNRLFVAENKQIEDTKNKAEELVSSLETQEKLSQSLLQQIQAYEIQNKSLQEKSRDQELELIKLKQVHNKAIEEASLFSEMADAPSHVYVHSFKKASTPSNSKKPRDLSPKKGPTKLDFLVDKLRSLDS